MTTFLRNAKQGMPYAPPLELVTASAQAITIDSGTALITSGAAALLIVLGTPDARNDGARLSVVSASLGNHTMTITGGVGGVGAGADLATFGGGRGDGIEFVASGGAWYTVDKTNVTLS